MTSRPLLLAALLASAFLPAHAQPPATRRARELVALINTQEEAPRQTTALLRRKLGGDLMALAVVVQDAPPYRLDGIGQRPPRRAGEAAEPAIASDADMASELERYVTALAAADVFSGSRRPMRRKRSASSIC